MRRLLSLLGVVATTPVLLAVPVLTRPAVSPHPVSPRVAEVAVSPLPSTRGVVADTGPRSTKPFTLAGVSWRRGTLVAGTHVELRTRAHGTWSSWTTLGTPDEAPDNGSPDAQRAARLGTADSDPVWVGASDGVQARVVDAAGHRAAAPADMHVVLVDGGSSGSDGSPGPGHPLGAVANAEQAQPTIYTRAQWGADESLRKSACPKGPDYSSTIKMGFIHHTDGTNAYTASQVPSIIRSIYAYHVQSNGWCDIGYNFLVDRFGRIWEGRYGGITKAVIGAHTGGFNTDSFGTSLIGNFSTTAPTTAMLSAVEQLFAWKLGMYYLDPRGTATMKAASFSGSRYATGTFHTFNLISGHRDADYTTCPGSSAYSKLASIRTATTALIGAGFVAPSVSPSTIRMLTSGAAFQVHAGVLGDQSWTLTVTDSVGTTVKTLTGTATQSAPVDVAWNLTGLDDATPVPPGTYTVTLTGTNSAGATDRPYTGTVTITPPITINGPATTSYGSPVTLSGIGSAVDVTVTKLADKSTSSPAVTYAKDGTWSAKFTADGDYSWSAATPDKIYTSPTSTTLVTPNVTTPAVPTDRRLFVSKGQSVALAGTGLPGSQLVAVTTAAGGSPVTGAPVTVASDGTWNGVTVTPSAVTTVSLQRVGPKGPDPTLAAAPLTVYPVGTVTTTAPASGYAQRAFTVTGNAGAAPLSVQLSLRPAGGSWAVASTTQADSSGAFKVSALLPDTTSGTTVAWRVSATAGGVTPPPASGTATVNPVFAPRATAVRLSTYRASVRVSGTAVPGDAVRLYTRPASGGTWTRVSTTTASATDGAFSPAFTIVRDTSWQISTPTGTVTGTVYVRPTLRAPRTARSGSTVYVSGYAVPGQRVYVYKRVVGTSAWGKAVTSAVARSTGYWVAHFRIGRSNNVVARLHGHSSGVVTIRVA